MMGRRPIKERRRVIVYVVCMWVHLLHQYVLMLLNSTNTRSRLQCEDDIPRTLPHSREVYRTGFLLNATRTTDVNCINLLQVKRTIFAKLCSTLTAEGGLKRTKNMEVDEMVAIFLLIIGHNAKNRTCQLLFHRSGETIYRAIHSVLLAVLNIHTLLMAHPVAVPDNSTDHTWKHFKGCVGAIDGTMVNVRTTKARQSRFRTRKGTTAINVLGVITQNMNWIYCLAGWEGSTHDSRVLRDALSHPGGLRVPEGSYYLCDVGYANANGFLAPYRGQRYHLQEWGRNRPLTAEEYFNKKHTSARIVIERGFGVLKMRWALLRDTSWYSPKMVGLFFTACCILHNFIRREGGPDVFEMAYAPSNFPETGTVFETIDDAPEYVQPTEEWTQFRHNLAQSIWANRGR